MARIPPPKGDPDGAAQGAGVRLLLRLLPGRGRLRPPHRRPRARRARASCSCPTGRIYEVQQVGRLHPRHAAGGRAVRRPGRLPHRGRSSGSPTPRSARPSPTRCRPTAEPLPGLSRRQAHGLLRASTRSRTPTTRPCATRWRSSGSTTPAFNFEPETSLALGYGFRCGFLGMLHMEIVQERLEREFNLSLIVTAPSVQLQGAHHGQGEMLEVDNPSKLPPPDQIEQMEEPYVRGSDLRAHRVHERRSTSSPRTSAASTVARVHRQARAHPASTSRWPRSSWTSTTG